MYVLTLPQKMGIQVQNIQARCTDQVKHDSFADAKNDHIESFFKNTWLNWVQF